MSESTGHRRQLSAGGWYAVLGDRVTLLLPGDERARVAGLWELVDAGADFDEVLDGLLAGGIRTLTGFVLVGHGDEHPGAGPRRGVRDRSRPPTATPPCRAPAEAMWADRTLGGVTGGTVVLEDAGDGVRPRPHLGRRAGRGRLRFGDAPSPQRVDASRRPVADPGRGRRHRPTRDDPGARADRSAAEPAEPVAPTS